MKALTALGIIAVLPKDILKAQTINNKPMQKADSTIQQILAYGMHAPSSHNTQPWKVKIDENKI
ncbi:MAG: nitroreductase family protein, partial [Bacteroidetes bacterium]|nr:nitroreductase family protein [Bacteroidota bacterium]